MDTAYTNSASGTRDHSGLNGRLSSAVAVGAPLSPVRAQMHRQQELLSELRQQHTALCDALMPVMAHDPRDPVPTAGAALKEGNGPSCDFERELMQQNEDLHGSIRRLREIHSALRL